MTAAAPELEIDDWMWDDTAVVAPSGQLAVATYSQLRDHLTKIGADQPRAIVVDLARLRIHSAAAFAVFATVHTRLTQWPGVPLLLVRGQRQEPGAAGPQPDRPLRAGHGTACAPRSPRSTSRRRGAWTASGCPTS